MELTKTSLKVRFEHDLHVQCVPLCLPMLVNMQYSRILH